MHVDANTVNGFGIVHNHNKSYRGNWHNANSKTRHVNIINGHGNYLNIMINNGAICHFKVTKRHGRRALRFKIGPSTAYYYRSKAYSRRHD